ncbi:EAL domain-containing protein [Alteromonas sp. 1_MG-2023]|uniref:bifunctional diguanylate cyclase/phosphodiesterase n=1 Tax=Alteromonas sp. 1_MG-2023 TaxID=3062669 RepID=UPI0026E1C22E|nr:EAL domain-containing protein [Alteromonas sp. 1_MG-2023]MDO6567491.1 EAL domain-containing protein [Alteromonas sp. 1_MG-2023]
MKLSTQLSVSLLIFLLAVFAGSFFINVKMTKEYVNEQLATHAQDTATSLGLAMAPFLSQENGQAVAETMVNAIFDRGYYQTISLKDSNGETLIIRQNPNRLNTVPNWFTEAVHVTPPIKDTELNDGWTIAGRLSVQSHPGLANEKLWESITQSAIMFAIAFVVAYLVLLIIIHQITKPLRIVTEKISDIQNQKFSEIDYQPFTKEFSFITLAVNKLSRAVESMFKELTARAEQFKAIAYGDTLTGLSNRNAFNRHMNALLSGTASVEQGYVVLIRLTQLARINNLFGGAEGDDYVTTAAKVLKSAVREFPDKVTLFRVSGSDFALLMEAVSQEECENRLKSLAARINKIDFLKDGDKTAWLGAAKYSSNNSFAEVLEKADSALLAATKLDRGWQFASELTHIHSNTEWRERLNNILLQQYADILIQPIFSTENKAPCYYEGFARFKDKATNTDIPMSQLIPASERLHLVPQVDRLVTSLIVSKLMASSHTVAANIASASIANAEFCEWLGEYLKENKSLCSRLAFEIEDSAIIYYREATLKFCEMVKSAGCIITIEHFGDNLASLSGLRAIQPDFVKISGKLTKNIHEDKDNQLFVSSLVSIANGLQIKVIAELVESELESNALSKIQVVYQQGYHFAKPTAWRLGK